MSEQSLEVVRRIYEAWHEGRSARDLMDAEIEYINPPDAVEPGTRRGRATFSRFRDAFEDVHIEPYEFIDTGDEVVVLANVHATGRESGVPIEWRHGYIWTVERGVATRFRWFNDPAQALQAAGIAP